MSLGDVISDQDYEKMYKRELTFAGAYVPIKGIRGLGWRGWRDLPAADLVRSLIEWHNGFIRDHVDEPFYLFFHKMIERGELTIDELKEYYSTYYGFVNNMFPWEGLITARLHEACQLELKDPVGIREIRDLFRAHFYEEAGHEELLADFCGSALGLDRVKNLYLPEARRLLNKNQGYLQISREFFKKIYGEGHFTEAAVLMFAERDLPKPHRRIRQALKRVYGFPDRNLVYFDIHSYIDIYHERYGQYIMAKYATTKELGNKVKDLFEKIILTRYESEKAAYNTFAASRR